MAATLFSPVSLGRYRLPHRVVLAPMKRLRSLQPGDTPSPMMVTFYGQRASQDGLLIAESASISRSARSYLGAPGIYTDDHAAHWAEVTAAVHAKGGRIFLQLIHPGRQAHSSLIDGQDPVAPSVDNNAKLTALTTEGWVPASPHRALDRTEITNVVDQFGLAAQLALQAGFDGVELHGANGYLVDQFLQDGTNRRDDDYGGPVANRALHHYRDARLRGVRATSPQPPLHRDGRPTARRRSALLNTPQASAAAWASRRPGWN
jgi:N-ethylmaleimide reductase